jgi:hypothetical protein
MLLYPYLKRTSSEETISRTEYEKKKKIVSEYLHLFNSQNQNIMKQKHNIFMKSKYPFSYFSCQDSNYLFVYKIHPNNSKPLGVLAQTEKDTASPSPVGSWADWDLVPKPYCISYEEDSTAEFIKIIYDGNLQKMVNLGDSMFSYHFFAKKLYFKFNSSSNACIVFKGNKHNPSPSSFDFNILLYKKRSDIYVIIMYSDAQAFHVNEQSILQMMK